MARLQSFSKDLVPYNNQDTEETHRCWEPRRAHKWSMTSIRVFLYKYGPNWTVCFIMKHSVCLVVGETAERGLKRVGMIKWLMLLGYKTITWHGPGLAFHSDV